jgi:hypothetical protein
VAVDLPGLPTKALKILNDNSESYLGNGIADTNIEINTARLGNN